MCFLIYSLLSKGYALKPGLAVHDYCNLNALEPEAGGSQV